MRGLVPVVVAVALLSTGCSSTGSNNGKPTTPREQLLPSAADFPSGAVVERVSPQELGRAREQLTESMKSATIEPPECGHRQVDIAKEMSAAKSKTSTVVAQNPTRAMTYAVGIVDDVEDLASFKTGVLGSCADVTTTVATAGRTIRETSHTVAVTPPQNLPADQALAYRTTTRVTTPDGSGETQTTQSMNGYAVVRGMSVEVRVNSLTGSVPPAEFQQLFTVAVTKIRNAR